ncbi:uncharacterized protein LOC124374568 [Homalodisca vitripennis]|uniref:uncharacterized protein LOC124374568 n=1 Tax=Homalodisca vitripennis TaxID=197043 RepID=UPI001EEC3C56|nr:uncharacterized protein LOC124374568 [Homalodisca vitripennis]
MLSLSTSIKACYIQSGGVCQETQSGSKVHRRRLNVVDLSSSASTPNLRTCAQTLPLPHNISSASTTDSEELSDTEDCEHQNNATRQTGGEVSNDENDVDDETMSELGSLWESWSSGSGSGEESPQQSIVLETTDQCSLVIIDLPTREDDSPQPGPRGE